MKNDGIISSRRQSDPRAMLLGRPVNQLIQSASKAQRSQTADHLAHQRIEVQYQSSSKFEVVETGSSTASDLRVFVAQDNHIYARCFELWSHATGGLHTTRVKPTLPRMAISAAQLRVDQLASIQSAFGLPIQTLAEVLAVSRAQIYKWLDASNSVTLQESSQQRLSAVGRLASRWRKLSGAPLSPLIREPLAGGSTVLQLLCGETIDEHACETAFVELARRLSGLAKSESQRMAETGYTRRPSRRSLPSDE